MKLLFAMVLSLAICCPVLGAEIISLGYACNVARASRYNGLRQIAYPFDWMITSMHSLRQAFEDDFSRVCQNMHLRIDGKSVIDAYGLVYIHDFPTIRTAAIPVDGETLAVHPLVENWEESIPTVQAKIQRRLARMKALLEDGTPVVFVRYEEMKRKDSEGFIKLFRKKFPHARLILAVLGSTSEFQTSWNIPHVINFYIDENDIRDWQGPVWRSILQEISLLEPEGWDPIET